MNKKILYLIGMIALVLSPAPALAHGSTPTSVATVPSGVMQLNLPAGKTTCLSLPLTPAPVFTGVVSGVTATTISVSTTTAPFTSSLAQAGAPYFVEFLSGNESGRIMLITSNTTRSLTLDTTDNQASWMNVSLTTAGYNVKAGDAFEIFAGDTLATVFGAGTSSNPLLLKGGTSASTADQVTLNRATCLTNATYFFNSYAGYWEQTGSSTNANNTVIYPYQAISVARVSGSSTASMFLLGQVEVAKATSKMISHSWTYGGTHYAVGVTLSQLNLGTHWSKSNNGNTADLMCVWNPTKGAFDNYYEDTSSNWHLVSNPSANQNNFVIPAGDGLCIGKYGVATGAEDFLSSAMPYTTSVE